MTRISMGQAKNRTKAIEAGTAKPEDHFRGLFFFTHHCIGSDSVPLFSSALSDAHRSGVSLGEFVALWITVMLDYVHRNGDGTPANPATNTDLENESLRERREDYVLLFSEKLALFPAIDAEEDRFAALAVFCRDIDCILAGATGYIAMREDPEEPAKLLADMDKLAALARRGLTLEDLAEAVADRFPVPDGAPATTLPEPDAERPGLPSRDEALDEIRGFETAKKSFEDQTRLRDLENQARVALWRAEIARPRNKRATASHIKAFRAMARQDDGLAKAHLAMHDHAMNIDAWTARCITADDGGPVRSVLEAFSPRAMETSLESMAAWDGISHALIASPLYRYLVHAQLVGTVPTGPFPIRTPPMPEILAMLRPEMQDALLAQDIDGNIVLRSDAIVRLVAFEDIDFALPKSTKEASAIRAAAWQESASTRVAAMRSFAEANGGPAVWRGMESTLIELTGRTMTSKYRAHLLKTAKAAAAR